MAQMYRTTPKQIFKILQENHRLQGVVTQVLRRKVMKFLVDNMAKDETAKVEDKKAETKTADKTEDKKVEKTESKSDKKSK
jgi:hypothetical protein